MTNKPIFEPGDFHVGCDDENCNRRHDVGLDDKECADLANAKLASLGIDAGSWDLASSLVKLYERRIDVMQKTMAEMKQRLTELERLLAEAPTVYGNPDVPNSWGLSRTGWCDKPMTHTAKLVDIQPIEGKK